MTVKSNLSKIPILLVLSAVTSQVWAAPIFVEGLVAPTVAEFLQPKPLTSNVISFANSDGRPTQSAAAAAFDPSDRFSRRSLALMQRGDILSQRGVNDNDPAITAHYIGVSLYHAIYGIDSGVATDLLASYQAIGRVRNEIISTIKAPLDSIGLSNDPSLQEQDGIAATGIFNYNNLYDDTLRRSDMEKILHFAEVMLSLSYIPYYILIFGIYIIFITVRARRSTRRAAGRSGSLRLAGTQARRHRDGTG